MQTFEDFVFHSVNPRPKGASVPSFVGNPLSVSVTPPTQSADGPVSADSGRPGQLKFFQIWMQ